MGAKWSFSVCYIACSIRCLLSLTSVWVAPLSLALDVNLLSMKKMKVGLKWYFPTATDTTGSWKLRLREIVRQNEGTIKKINDGELHFYNQSWEMNFLLEARIIYFCNHLHRWNIFLWPGTCSLAMNVTSSKCPQNPLETKASKLWKTCEDILCWHLIYKKLLETHPNAGGLGKK